MFQAEGTAGGRVPELFRTACQCCVAQRSNSEAFGDAVRTSAFL